MQTHHYAAIQGVWPFWNTPPSSIVNDWKQVCLRKNLRAESVLPKPGYKNGKQVKRFPIWCRFRFYAPHFIFRMMIFSLFKARQSADSIARTRLCQCIRFHISRSCAMSQCSITADWENCLFRILQSAALYQKHLFRNGRPENLYQNWISSQWYAML